MIPTKLVRLVANYLAGPLSLSINNSLNKEGLFPKNAKVVSVAPVDIKMDDKNGVKFSPNKFYLKNLFMKILKARLENKQFKFSFYVYLWRILQYTACIYLIY